MPTTLHKEKDGTITLKIVISAAKIKKTREAVMDDIAKNAKLSGFRPGKAPRKLVEESVNPQKLQEEILKEVLPEAYTEAVKEHNIRPVMNPKIHVDKVEEGKDWEITAVTCEMPEISLKDYKKRIQDVTAKSKIAVPGKEQTPPNMDEIMKAFLESVEAQIPSILVQQEADRLLVQTLDEIKRLGLTLDQYLASTGKSPDALRGEYEAKALQDMKFEFALQKVAEAEKISVGEKEIEEALAKAKDPQERAQLEQNRYLLASILRQQKTLDFLRSL